VAFDFDETSPADNSYISDFPANERAARTAKKGAFEVDHELTAGYHNAIRLNEQAANPDPPADVGALFTKDSGTQPELYYQEESAGDVVTITEAGWLYAIALAAAAPEAARKMLANFLLGKGIKIQGHDTAEAAYLDLIGVDASDELIVGESDAGTIAKVLLKAASDNADPEQQFVVDWGSGEKRIFHEGHMGDGSLLDADKLDGYHHTSFLSFETDTPLYYEGGPTTMPDSDDEIRFTHGLGSTPRMWIAVAQCNSTIHGYLVGDEIPIGHPWMGGLSYGNIHAYANDTYIYVCSGANNTMQMIEAYSDANRLPQSLTDGANRGKWDIVVRAWK
jgi:hypothetical protein